ncbi:cell division protein FtsA [Aquimarina sp. MMG015]|uniref:cell division protein FtsA n=1 Tax=unclassified Aquimarina TaxID=2627091 RepID=UPI000E4AB422|nr:MULTISPECIES: cell division protein FtsA [unclassified Aquimarina]AXT58092.1 cell division protein FtsA [Aquimarina sp. AD1]MBQ4803005.1 cell division protein FtsA [Aquimarina sp. MMG015]RKN37246.1 cell division protein FtsA [Aquimarina sp. AD1]
MAREEHEIAVGLDIGTTKIVAMVGRYNEYGKMEVLGVGKSKSLGVHRGVVNNITQTIQSIQQAVQEAESVSGVKISEVTVGIAGQHIRSLQHSDYITRPNADAVIDEDDIDTLCNQVHKLVMLPGEEILHVLPQEYKVDGQAEIKEPVGMYGGRLEANFHVVVGQVTSIRNIGRCVKSSGLELSDVTLEPLASANAVLSQEEKEAGVALIDIGGGTTDLAIFKDGIIRHTAVIPFGGNVITEDIKEGCSIIEKQAELLKIKFGSAWPGENKDNEIVSIPGLRGREPKEITLKNLSKIIHARVVEIIEQVFLEIKNYGHESPKKKLIAGIVLTGGGSQLKHLKQLVEYITGMDTRIGYPNEHLAGNSDPETTSPMYATAVGLVMDSLVHISKQKKAAVKEAVVEEEQKEETATIEGEGIEEEKPVVDSRPRKNILEKWTEKFKEFLDNAE